MSSFMPVAKHFRSVLVKNLFGWKYDLERQAKEAIKFKFTFKYFTIISNF